MRGCLRPAGWSERLRVASRRPAGARRPRPPPGRGTALAGPRGSRKPGPPRRRRRGSPRGAARKRTTASSSSARLAAPAPSVVRTGVLLGAGGGAPTISTGTGRAGRPRHAGPSHAAESVRTEEPGSVESERRPTRTSREAQWASMSDREPASMKWPCLDTGARQSAPDRGSPQRISRIEYRRPRNGTRFAGLANSLIRLRCSFPPWAATGTKRMDEAPGTIRSAILAPARSRDDTAPALTPLLLSSSGTTWSPAPPSASPMNR